MGKYYPPRPGRRGPHSHRIGQANPLGGRHRRNDGCAVVALAMLGGILAVAGAAGWGALELVRWAL